MSSTDTYDDRLRALNDALWLVEHGAANPHPEAQAHRGDPSYAYLSSSGSAQSSYDRANVALDYARFLLDEEVEDVPETQNFTVTVNGTPDPEAIKEALLASQGRRSEGLGLA
jgi:hypothetical protein